MPPKLVVSFFGQKCRLLIKPANDLRTTNVKPKGMLDIFYLFNFKSTTDFMLSFYEYLSGFVPQH